MSISPASAVGQIGTIVGELRLPGVTPQHEAQLEQQLVTAISGANPSANWGMIATIADDVADPTVSTSAVNVDVMALDRMVQPTDAANLSAVIGALAGQLRGQSPYPAGTSVLSGTALSGATAITLPSTVGMFNGDTVQVTLDNGATFNDTITTILNNIVNLAKPLPSQASSGNRFVNTTQQTRDQTTSSSSTGSIVTSLTAGVAFGTSIVQVKSATGMNVGDPVQIGLADGSTLDTTIASITGSTTLTADSLANTSAVTVGSTTGMNDGDAVQIKLDNGTTFDTIIASIAGNTVNLAAPLPSQASTGATFTDPTDVKITLATTLPVGAADGASFTDTINVQPANTISFSSPLMNPPGASQGSSTLTLVSVGGMATGDTVQVALDNGSVFNTTLTNVNSLANTVTLATPLPSNALFATATVTDMISTAQQSAAFKPAVSLSPQMLAMLQLQLDVLIGAANPNADTKTLQTTLASLVSSTLSSTQFQQDVTALVQLAQQGNTLGASLSILA